MKKAVIESLRR